MSGIVCQGYPSRAIFYGSYVGLLVGKLLGIMLYPVVGSVKLEYPIQTPPW